MFKRTFQLLLVACLATGTLRAANDPFAGKWKLNPSKSKFTGQMRVEVVGPNRYAITFVEVGLGSGLIDTVVADGTDQPAVFGTTLSVTIEKPDAWKVVRKSNGHTLLTGIWKLSEDGNILGDAFTGYRADGSTLRQDYVFKRRTGTSGFPGTWDSTSDEVNSDSVYEFQIEPYEGDGLSFITPTAHEIQDMRFDGKDYPDAGPNVVPDSASSGRRLNEHALEMTDKIKDKVMDTRRIELSADLKTLTMTIRPVGQNKPNILVFERQ
jgi:hypothetical protein